MNNELHDQQIFSFFLKMLFLNDDNNNCCFPRSFFSTIIKIIFLNKFNSIKVKKILQILKTLYINVQLLSLHQFNKNIFKLTIVNLHLIVDRNSVFIFF